MPDYDLKFFTDSNKSMPELKHSIIVKNELLKEMEQKNKTNYTPFVWLAIAAVLGLLTFLSRRMMTEMKGRNQ
jgi:ABC-type arginine transport system permease subunit